ncbi:hypothetical protein L596_026676 [Steinernema carpocapsae]|uniref:G protein-coupled receptor n=1 Tax=Steinernema carpocapsae TaxID=34508 RepID=A0A4U5M221_STECR|nr:hypothetical protein L596_026676 [Steinernema carpocapsae]
MSYVLVGCTYAVLSVITLPLYFRILYIFWSTRKYRKFQSYFLMIQIGVAQCGMAPGHAFAGLAVALQCDFLSLASFFIKVVTGCRRAEALLSLALAYDRFVVMCEVLSALAWIYGFFYFTILCSPYADLTVIPSTYTSAYDNSSATLVLQEIGTYTTLAALAFTFVLYLIIVWTLIQHKLELTLVHISFNEKNILLQAVVRFLGDTSVTLLYHIVPQFVGQSDWMSIVTHIG